jgi:protein-S-isoprenylcysteine O-methyltransferase Ste14
MEDLATRFADLLESSATRVRSMTVDRAQRAVKVASLVLPALVLGVLAIVFLFMTIHQALAIPLEPWAAFAIEAGVFGIVAALLWWKRTEGPKEEG